MSLICFEGSKSFMNFSLNIKTSLSLFIIHRNSIKYSNVTAIIVVTISHFLLAFKINY